MEMLYRSVWGNTSCLDQALQTVGIGLAIIPVIMAGIGVLVWWPFRKKPAESRLVLRLMTITTLLLTAAVTIWFVFSSQQLREVQVGAAGFDVKSCRGLWQRDVFHPADSVGSIRHRLGRTGGKSPTTIDEIVVELRNASPLILPVSEIGNFDIAVLRRSLPRHAFAAWASSLRDRGKPVPDWLQHAATGMP